MHISGEGLEEFITICEEEYGVRLSPEEARVCAMRLLLFYELIYQPLPGERNARQTFSSRPEQEAQ